MSKKYSEKIEKDKIEFVFNLQNYSVDALYGAAYAFLDKAYIFFDNKSPKKILVSLKSKKNSTKKQLENLKDEFLNELLSCETRARLSKNNKKIREFIVGQALFSAVGESEEDFDDSFNSEDDPLGIAVPWEEKYGNNKIS